MIILISPLKNGLLSYIVITTATHKKETHSGKSWRYVICDCCDNNIKKIHFLKINASQCWISLLECVCVCHDTFAEDCFTRVCRKQLTPGPAREMLGN